MPLAGDGTSYTLPRNWVSDATAVPPVRFSAERFMEQHQDIATALSALAGNRPTLTSVNALIATAKAELIGGAGSAFDTLAELAAHATSTSNPHSVTKTQVGLGSADNTADADKPVSTATEARMPRFRSAASTPAGPHNQNDFWLNTTTGALSTYTGSAFYQIVTPADLAASIAALINAAPGALDTLNELAAALGNDANFAATMTTALAGKASTVHTHSASQISDSTSLGRALIMAADQAAAQAAIGASGGDGSALLALANSWTVNGAASTPAAKWTGTWFTGGSSTSTKPQILIEPTGTTSTAWGTAGTGIGVNAPSGFAGNLFDYQLNGVSVGSLTAAGLFKAETLCLGLDAFLLRDAANRIAQRNGTNPQAFRLYNTFTDASNGEWLGVSWASNVVTVGAERNGTGAARVLKLTSSGEIHLEPAGAGGLVRLFGATNTSLFINNWVGFGTPANGVMRLLDSSGADFNRIQFGGGTTAFPALKRDGAGLSARLADDSAGTWLKVLRTTVAGLPSASTAGAGAMAIVTDALAPVTGSTIASGGAVQSLVISNGTNWIAASGGGASGQWEEISDTTVSSAVSQVEATFTAGNYVALELFFSGMTGSATASLNVSLRNSGGAIVSMSGHDFDGTDSVDYAASTLISARARFDISLEGATLHHYGEMRRRQSVGGWATTPGFGSNATAPDRVRIGRSAGNITAGRFILKGLLA